MCCGCGVGSRLGGRFEPQLLVQLTLPPGTGPFESGVENVQIIVSTSVLGGRSTVNRGAREGHVGDVLGPIVVRATQYLVRPASDRRVGGLR
jgi:hypothetical protein